MQIDFKKETLHLSEMKWNQSATLLAEGDVIVPDVKPDIREILLTEASAHITSRDQSEGKLNVAGTVLVRILYIPDEDASVPKSMEAKFDFKDSFDMPVDEALDCNVKCSTEHIEFSMINSRKLNVKVVVAVSCRGYSKRDLELAADAADSDVLKVRKKPFGAYQVVADTSREFVITESLEVPSAKPDIDEVIKLDARAVKGDCKIMSGKILLKGTLMMNTLYAGLDAEGGIECMEHELAFSEMADIEGLGDDCLCNVTYEVKNVYWTVKEDVNGDARIVSLDIVLRADITASRTVEGEVIDDCYSTAGTADIKSERVRLDELLSEGVSHESIKEIVEIPEGLPPANVIYSLECKPKVQEIAIADEKVMIKGKLIAFVLYGSTEGENAMYSLVREFEFEHSVAVDGIDETAFCECGVTEQGSSFTLNAASEIELRSILEFYIRALKKNEIDVISGCEVDEEAAEAKQHGMIIYFVQSGDTVWDIAKRYRTDCEKIIALNKLDNTRLLAGQKILIPGM